MPRPRFKKLPEEKQRQILEVAKAEFAESGFEGASYNRIIERAGLSKGAMYYYFDDKTDLYATVLEDVNLAIMAHVGEVDLTVDFWRGLETFVHRSITFVRDHPELTALGRGLTEVPRRGREGPIGELYRRSKALTQTILEQGQAVGAVRTDLPTSLLVDVAFGMGEAIDFWLLDHFAELTDDQDIDGIVHTIVTLWRDLAGSKEEA